MKKLTVMLLVMTLVFGLAACGNASEKGSNVTETQAQSAEDTGAGNAELNKLYEKENAIIAKHQELWNTVFNNIDKDKAADAGEQNYGTFLETQLDHVKDQFSEADLKKLDKDIEEIKKIEDQVTELTAQMGTENSGAQSANAETSVFPSFQAKDLDGNKVDSSIFSQNAVTVVNFWFNGCTPCVEELPALNKLNGDPCRVSRPDPCRTMGRARPHAHVRTATAPCNQVRCGPRLPCPQGRGRGHPKWRMTPIPTHR